MDISPPVNLLKSYRGDRIDYLLLIGEGSDNALDATARMVEITIEPDAIVFRDDGIGVDRKRIAAVFSPGDHAGMSSTQIGRFGVGITTLAINAGDTLEVDSISKDGRVRAEVNWRHLLAVGGRQWVIADPRWLPYAVGSATGTRIIIGSLRKAPAMHLDKIIEELAQRFYPAIADGRRLVVNGVEVPLLADPRMGDVIERDFNLSGGRTAKLRAGILLAPSKLFKVHVGYRHRIIMPQSPIGCGRYSGIHRMFARVQIEGPWHLARFKNDLTDEDQRGELDVALYEALLPILRKCSTEAFSARVTRLLDLVNDKVPDDLRPARPKAKNPQGRQGRKLGRTGKVIAEGEEKDKAPARIKRARQDRLLITTDGVLERDGIGGFDLGRPHRVNLSKDHPYIAQLLEQKDEGLAAQSIYVIAIALYEEGMQRNFPELPLHSFGLRIAETLGLQEGLVARGSDK